MALINEHNTPEQKKVLRRAWTHFREACDLLCCCNSPFSHPRDQQKVVDAFNEFTAKLKSIK